MSEVTIADIIEAIAEGYSDTEDINPWESMDNAKTVMDSVLSLWNNRGDL